ncbi:MAG: hypothetical protein HFG37_04030 [Eubacterium sp.]|nr:hypothetical protein [Eubacterium sp.]
MSEYGIRIKNIEASTLLEYNRGLRSHYEVTNAMFTNSLFCDYLKVNGLKLLKDESTRDIICLEFNFGTRSYEQEMEHLKKTAKKARLEYKEAKSRNNQNEIDKKMTKRRRIMECIAFARENKDRYEKLSKEEIRRLLYNNGVDVEYVSRKRDGSIKKREVIHYQMLYRSTGKAKKGSCMFIRDKLHKKARRFLYMGIKCPENNAQILELSAYAPLVSSTIVDRIRINPRNILILEDIDKSFITNVISIETDQDKHCHARRIDHYELKNTLFDGQALIDSSIFPDWADGYILLRHHFCKMAAFCSNIQTFFQDYFGERYPDATVKDMFGREHFVKDIQVITTNHSMKWLKFNKSYDDWCKKVNENHNLFGIVKTAHKSKLGDVQKMSYQMVNSLDESIMENVVRESVAYVERLKQDDDFFLEYLQKNSNFSNDHEALVALSRQNREFTRSEYFRERRKTIIKTYVRNMKTGKLIQNAENLVIVGSPYAMLLYGATGNKDSVDDDDTFQTETGTIQCYTERFEVDRHLAFFRSPFNSKNNLTYLHNTCHEKLKKYFRFGKLILAVNMIGTDFQDRNNGSDQDSDSGYCTDQADIVEHARKCYADHPTIVNNIPKEKNVYRNTMDDFAMLDNRLANCQRDIGESSNLAQIAQTYACNFSDPKYTDYVCILSVLAQVAIDNAKRCFDIQLTDEIQRIKEDMEIQKHKYPNFWKLIHPNINPEKINSKLHCPMNCLYDLRLNRFRNTAATLPMSYFYKKFELEKDRRKSKKVEDLIANYSLHLYQYNTSGENISDRCDDYLLLRKDFEDMVSSIRKVYLSDSYIGLMSWLIDRAFLITCNVNRNRQLKKQLDMNRSLLLKVLYQVNSGNLLKIFSNHC